MITRDDDEVLWLEQTAAKVANMNLGLSESVDNGLVEFLMEMSRRERSALKSHLLNLAMHVLKFMYQPEYPHKRSWEISIRNSRREIETILDVSPSLKGYLEVLLADPKVAKAAAEDAETEIGRPVAYALPSRHELFEKEWR